MFALNLVLLGDKHISHCALGLGTLAAPGGTYIVFLLWCHGINEVFLAHEQLALVILLRMTKEIRTRLV